jgi:peptidoglycan/LPS O-acetylase OafA/YrhL
MAGTVPAAVARAAGCRGTGNLARVTDPSTAHGQPAPGSLRWAVVLLAVQALAVVVVTGVLAYDDVVASPTSRGAGWTLTGTAAALAALLVFLDWSLARRRAWARGPAVVLELMLLPIGYYMVKGGLPWVGVPLIVLALATAGLLVAPATRAALGVR